VSSGLPSKNVLSVEILNDTVVVGTHQHGVLRRRLPSASQAQGLQVPALDSDGSRSLCSGIRAATSTWTLLSVTGALTSLTSATGQGRIFPTTPPTDALDCQFL